MGNTTNYNLPYPDDYTAIADVPEAVKQLAEATDTALGGKQSSTDNTLQTTDKTVSGAINEVNTGLENANDNIENLDTQVETIEDDLYGAITKSVTTGETTLNNTVKDRDLSIPNIYGEDTQESTTGKNFCPTQISVWELGTYDASGNKATQNSRARISSLIPVAENQTIYVNTFNSNYKFVLRGYDSNSNFVKSYGVVNNETTIQTISGSTNIAYLGVSIYNPNNDSSSSEGQNIINQITSGQIKPFICLNSVADKSFEPYTGGIPAPNPSFPFPINSTTGNNTVTERGINTLQVKAQTRTHNGVTYTVYEDGSIKVNGTASGNSFLVVSNNTNSLDDYSTELFTLENTFYANPQTNASGVSMLYRGTDGNYYNVGTVAGKSVGAVYLQVASGVSITNQMVYPIIVNGSSTTVNWQPYITPITKQLNLGDIELNEINTTKDVIFKNNPKSDLYQSNLDLDEWYVKKNTNKKTFVGSNDEGWVLDSTNSRYYSTTAITDYDVSKRAYSLCNNYTYNGTPYFALSGSGNYLFFGYPASNVSTLELWQSWLSTHNTEVLYALATPTYTKITDSTLISQLEAIQNLKQLQGTTVIEIDDIKNFKVAYDGNKIEQINADLLLKQNITDNTLQTTHKTVPTAINEVNSIAKGANQAISYANYSAMATAINAMANTALNVGQNIYIITVDVPDLWVSSIESTSSTYTYTTDEAFTTALETNGYVQVGYYKLSALETQKVDLTTYVEFTDYATQNTAGVIKVWTSYNADNELGLNISTE